MGRTRIYVGNDELELNAGEVVAYTLQRNSIESADTFQSSFSNSFDIPLTRNNLAILGMAGLDADNQKAYQRTSCRVETDGIGIVWDGFFIVEQWKQRNATITVFNGIVDFFDLLGDTRLWELDFSAYTHVRNQANVNAGLLHDYTDGYVYSIYDRGDATSATDSFAIDELEPQLFIRTILDACAAHVGYAFTDNGFGLYNDAFFNKCVFPYVGGRRNIMQAYGLQAQNYEGSFTSFFLAFGDPSQFNFDTGRYTSPLTWNISINTDFYFQTTAGAGNAYNYEIVLYSSINGEIGRNAVAGIQPTADPVIDSAGVDINSYDAVAGETFWVELDTNTTISAVPYGNGTNLYTSGILIDVASGSYYFGNSLPDMKAKDFVKSVFKAFLAVPAVDAYAKTIQLDYFQELASEGFQSSAYDWSGKLDISREITVEYDLGYSQNNLVKWAEDDTLTDSAFNDLNLTANIASLPAESDIIELDFAPTESTAIVGGTFIVAKVDLLADPNEVLTPRLCYVEQYTGSDKPNIDVGRATNTDFSALKFIDQTSAQDFSKGSWGGTYFASFSRVIARPAKVTAYFKLAKADVSAIDLSRLVYLNIKTGGLRLTGFYWLQKINEYQGRAITEVELVAMNTLGDLP